MHGNMKKKKNLEEREKLHLNRGVEILLKVQEKKQPELKIFNLKFNRNLFDYKINFEFFITKKSPLQKDKC